MSVHKKIHGTKNVNKKIRDGFRKLSHENKEIRSEQNKMFDILNQIVSDSGSDSSEHSDDSESICSDPPLNDPNPPKTNSDDPDHCDDAASTWGNTSIAGSGSASPVQPNVPKVSGAQTVSQDPPQGSKIFSMESAFYEEARNHPTFP